MHMSSTDGKKGDDASYGMTPCAATKRHAAQFGNRGKKGHDARHPSTCTHTHFASTVSFSVLTTSLGRHTAHLWEVVATFGGGRGFFFYAVLKCALGVPICDEFWTHTERLLFLWSGVHLSAGSFDALFKVLP